MTLISKLNRCIQLIRKKKGSHTRRSSCRGVLQLRADHNERNLLFSIVDLYVFIQLLALMQPLKVPLLG